MIQEYLTYLQDEDYHLNEFFVLPTLALTYKMYQRYMSKAAKSCSGKKFGAKTLCMIQYRLKAMDTIIKPELKNSLRECPKTKDPKGCREVIQKRLDKINKNEKKLQTKMASLQTKMKVSI